MASRTFVAAVIARRFNYTSAAADRIAVALSDADREQIEISARRRGASVEIAATIMAARMRAASRLQDGRAKTEAIEDAYREAEYHYRQIEAELPEGFPDEYSGRRWAPHGCREVRMPDGAEVSDGAD